ncbi:hypothetical protein TRVL_09345 [Trypanosoma vivax]|nr:hypothetical protein TRVL_09345 [Trypanosoma vivax]
MAQYSITAGLHCPSLQFNQREQLAPQVSAAVPAFFHLFMLGHNQPTSLFPHLLHSCQSIHITQNAFESLYKVLGQKSARNVVRGVTLPLISLVNAVDRVHAVNEIVL